VKPAHMIGTLARMDQRDTLVAFDELANIRRRGPDKKIVQCRGTFDLIHLGHLIHAHRRRLPRGVDGRIRGAVRSDAAAPGELRRAGWLSMPYVPARIPESSPRFQETGGRRFRRRPRTE
jgi:hypothetical protein